MGEYRNDNNIVVSQLKRFIVCFRYKEEKCGFRGETAGSVVIEWWRRFRRYNARCQHRRRSHPSRRHLADGARSVGHDRNRRLAHVHRGVRCYGHRHGRHGHRHCGRRDAPDRAAALAPVPVDVKATTVAAAANGRGQRDGRHRGLRIGARVAPGAGVHRTDKRGPGPAAVSRGHPVRPACR